ncbi:MAG: DUF5677 domain-containing protein [Kofleriaceae bacterium]
MSDASELVAELLRVAEAVGDAAIAKHTDLAGLGAMFLARAGQSTCSAVLLAKHGLNGDAMSVGRTITEMVIDYRYISLDAATRIKKFEDYDHVAKFKIAKAVDKLYEGQIDREAMRILQQRSDTAKQNNPESTMNWAGASLRDRAKAVDNANVSPINRVQIYELAYADACNASHSCYGTLEYALVGRNDTTAIRFGPMVPELKPADLAFVSMLTLVGDVYDANELADEALEARVKSVDARRRAFSVKY